MSHRGSAASSKFGLAGAASTVGCPKRDGKRRSISITSNLLPKGRRAQYGLRAQPVMGTGLGRGRRHAADRNYVGFFGIARSCTDRRPGVAPPEHRPNIVLILADDLGWGDVGFNGRREWATPNLDRLAARGTKFNRFYTAAAVCAPSRAALLTGKYTIHNGVSRNDDDLPTAEVTIAEALKAHGYKTALFGKWHHGKPRDKNAEYVHPLDQGFDEFFGFTDAVHAWEKFPTMLWEGRERKPSTGYADDLFTDRAIDFFKRNRETPFFLYLPYISAHFNIEAPADEIARNQGKVPETNPAAPLNTTYASILKWAEMYGRYKKNGVSRFRL